jgi:molybdate transport system substrate-binding protein
VRSFTAARRVGVLLLSAALLAGCATDTRGPATVPSGAAELTGTVDVYAAASLTGAFGELADAFEAQHPGVAVSTVFDGSSTLVTQIAEGAPADVFASAAEANMRELGERAIDPQVFATNTLVIAVPAGNPGAVRELADLARVTTVLCAPEVPCGAASVRLLAAADVTVTPASSEQNVTAVLTKVAAGEADAGLVYATDVAADERVEAIMPEGAADVVNRYPIAVLDDAPDAAAARAFVDLVLSAEGAAVLTRFGFGAP